MATKKKKSVKKPAKIQSFKLSKSQGNFNSLKITDQTVYWIVLLSLIFILFIWVLNAQMSAIQAINNI
ncbi:MAG: hypothetical protein WCQ49_00610 [Candidatus Saccharibacteria bacterium]